MKDSTRKEKLKKYSAAATTVLAAAGTVNAQIIYTDVSPDVVVVGNQMAYPLDLNNDTNVDFNFVTVNATGSGTTQGIPFTYVGDVALVQAVSSNQWAGYSGTNSVVYPSVLNLNDAIDGALNFYTNSASGGGTMAVDVVFDLGSLGTVPATAGPFIGVTDAYVGLSFDISGQTHYGWARIDVSADATTITVKDYAYDATPNTAIPAGDMGATSGITTAELTNVHIRQFGNNNIVVNVLEEVTGGKLLVTSTTGQVVKTINLVEGTNNLSLEGLASGIYVVSAQFNEGVVTEKVFVR
jgi:hypothetical protein